MSSRDFIGVGYVSQACFPLPEIAFRLGLTKEHGRPRETLSVVELVIWMDVSTAAACIRWMAALCIWGLGPMFAVPALGSIASKFLPGVIAK